MLAFPSSMAKGVTPLYINRRRTAAILSRVRFVQLVLPQWAVVRLALMMLVRIPVRMLVGVPGGGASLMAVPAPIGVPPRMPVPVSERAPVGVSMPVCARVAVIRWDGSACRSLSCEN